MTAIVVQLPGLEFPNNGGNGVMGRRRAREMSMNVQNDEDDHGTQQQDYEDEDDDDQDDSKPDGSSNILNTDTEKEGGEASLLTVTPPAEHEK
jgi:hypothetical protein